MADGTFRLVLLEATEGGAVDAAKLGLPSPPELADILKRGRAIEHLPGCRIFDIRWSSYIAYSVVNESYASGEPETSNGSGKLFVEYIRSEYLDYMRKASWACDDHPGPYKHWAAYCLNHVVNVASPSEPEITVEIATT
ncbi:conserved hypothetical protein [Burkholderia ambifaria MEX-5]|uniref:Uncharacterized protein n=1 Tax=Burkholderia ambifaria MEX-5 TaxID=396597 RepID=B1TBL4_9BURK|nr:conserved hypothetical protein [Burkholderia ambifaria MEX-5]